MPKNGINHCVSTVSHPPPRVPKAIKWCTNNNFCWLPFKTLENNFSGEEYQPTIVIYILGWLFERVNPSIQPKRIGTSPAHTRIHTRKCRSNTETKKGGQV
uniref:Uncharacterized protein n=1 Tax=Daphnia magna TaxID=35525 RepID=A0A0P4XG66_9CRUS